MRTFSFLLLIGLMAAPMLAQDAEPEGWTPEVAMQFKSITDTALSPDGKRVAYVVREPLMEGETSEYRSHIWMAGTDQSYNYQFTRGEHTATNPAFSPDGQWLAFQTDRSGEDQVWVMRLQGGEAEQVTEAKTGISAFQWAPDGKRIAYIMRDPDTEDEEKAKKEKRHVILVDQQYKYAHLYTVALAKDADGKRATQRLTGGDYHITGFDWAPNGKTLVFGHQANPGINASRSGRDLSTVPADSGAVTPLVSWPGSDRAPLYSPDGQWVAFVSQGGQPEPIGLGDVYLVPAAGGTPKKLAETPDRNANLLGWTGDGTAIRAIEPFRTTTHLFSIPADGSDVQMLTAGDGVHGAASFTPAGDQMAFVYEYFTRPPEVFVTAVEPYDRRQVSSVNKDVKVPPQGRTKVVQWTSFDGMNIEGLLTLPIGYQEGERYPLVLQIHGGPAGVFSQRFTGRPQIYQTQYFAQQGYAVLQPNPRGSTGYGKAFRYANFKDWGYGDYEDVMAGVDHAIETGVADPNRLFVMGWSYGGYLTSFLVTRTDRFKAASMGAGLPNLVSMVTTTDIPDYLVGHMGDEFWNDYETYEKHSAIYHIKNVTIPTQVIHGAEDKRVPFTQGQEFYVALKRLGVPTEMVVYPRTPHGPREPKLLMDVTDRILTWFERYMPEAEPAQ